MINKYIKKDASQTIILLHGTGGDETDLIPLGEFIDSNASLLGIRGNVLENGMTRFFKRLSFGVFDQENLKIEAKNLYQFILKSSETLSFDLNKVTILGYSNGANILAYMMMHYQMPIKLAIMLHPMVPSNERPTVNNYDTYALMTAGTQDTMVPIKQTLSLKDMFDGMLLKTELKQFESGHQLTKEEYVFIKNWYNKQNVKKEGIS